MAFSLSSHLLPRSSPHLPFFSLWGRYITYFQPPCPATPHQFLPLIHTPACSTHTRRHTDLSAVKYFSSRSPSPDTEQTLKCVKNLLMVRPPPHTHLSSLERPPPSSQQCSCLTSLTVDALLPPNTHTESHTHAHTHTHTRTHSYTGSPPPLPLFFHCDITHDAAVSESCAVAWRRGRRVGCKGLPPRSAVSCLGREWVGFQVLCCVCVCAY